MRPEEVLGHTSEQERQGLLSELRAAVFHSDWIPSDDITGRRPTIIPEDTPEQLAPEKKGPTEFRSWLEPENDVLLEAFINNYQRKAESNYLERIKELDYPENDQGLNIPSAQEQRILQLMTMGLTNIEIGEALEISDQTVKNHITHILKRLGTPDRTGAILHAFQNGMVEPLLITTTNDFSGYTELTDRERQVYKLLSTYGQTNSQLGESLFITEQTVKNHMTSVLRKLGAHDRQEVGLYEIKRRDAVLSGSKVSQKDFSIRDEAILTFAASPESLKEAYYISPYGFPQLNDKPNLNVLKKVHAGNLYEFTATALLQGYGDIDRYISPERQSIAQRLPDEQKSLLLELSGYFNDDVPLLRRADLLGLLIDDVKSELRSIKESGLPSLYQAMVFLHFSQLREARESLKKRQKNLESLRTANENPFIVPESQSANGQVSLDSFDDLEDELW